jgi:hypothetical protein
MIESDPRLCALFRELKANDGKIARSPSGGTPGMDNSLSGEQFDVATDNSTSEQGEGAAGITLDFGGLVGETRELLGIKEQGVDSRWVGFKIDFLMQESAGGIGAGRD